MIEKQEECDCECDYCGGTCTRTDGHHDIPKEETQVKPKRRRAFHKRITR